jgi:hypothetical protein
MASPRVQCDIVAEKDPNETRVHNEGNQTLENNQAQTPAFGQPQHTQWPPFIAKASASKAGISKQEERLIRSSESFLT